TVGSAGSTRVPHTSRAATISASPTMNSTNMAAISRRVEGEAPANSFHTKTPQAAATIVAPWPRPYEIAKPACSDAIRLIVMPKHQMNPPSRPTKWSHGVPRVKYWRYVVGAPLTGRYMKKEFQRKFESSTPQAKTN